MKRFLAGLPLGLLVLAHVAAAQDLPVRVVDVADEKAVFATVEAPSVVPARARIGGTMARLAVREGDAVTQGQVIGTVGDDKLLLNINALTAEITGLQSQLAQAQADLTRAETLYRQGAGARLTLDQAHTAMDVATATLQARIAARGVAQQQLAEGDVLAPADGRVLHVPVTLGTVVLAGDPVASIAAGAHVLRLRVPERHAQFLKVGDTIRLDGSELGMAATRLGTITLVYPQLEQGRVLADARVDGLGDFYVGQRVRVWIAAGTRPAIIIPASYVTTRAGLDYVHLRAAGTTLEIPVQRGVERPGPALADGLEILSGIAEGDTLVRP